LGELIAERTHAGLVAAIARGHKGGRPSKMDRSALKMAMTALEFAHLLSTLIMFIL